ncbi:PEP/pyruvate-binding domain-containing protein [Gimesia fumaroli]|uniref:Phosphoenolpyruvate synthase n=1 Tax=Gimesia fumaroli TaxID=2527976 RepID=A0A518IBJ5_9PLAN|nr:PEP/pyruvate-binding domain-containing protein [Gimesia fumaroli]QDV50471.1 Phosphoenolpyruvate synthase [Gimesia fumaroli]
MANRLIYSLSELDSSFVAEAGGKGASLGELMRAQAPVPPGFVVTSSAFQTYLASGDLKQDVIKTVQALNAGQIDLSQAHQQIRSCFEGVAIPGEIREAVNEAANVLNVTRVSVRSSATCEDSATSAWAGQLETFLDVRPDAIMDKIRDCWLSLFSESALSYGATHGFAAGEISVAVVVQQMVASDISGIGFSVHPVTQEPEIQLIEACLGLGEAIVSGRIVPDQFVVERGTNQILESMIGEQKEALWMGEGDTKPAWQKLDGRGSQPKISTQQVTEFAGLLTRLHDHYGHPIDTEWAIENGQFQVLQARPITTLAEEYNQTLIDESQEWQFTVRRPFFLLAASILPYWLDAKHADNTLGGHLNEALLVQDETEMMNLFYSKESADAFLDRIGDLFQNHRDELIRILRYGLGIYAQAPPVLERGLDGFQNLEELEDFFADVAQHTTVFPAWVLIYIEAHEVDDPEVRALAEQIRSHSLYPVIERNILEPLAAQTAEQLGFSQPDRTGDLVLWSELKAGTVTRELLESRLQAVEAGDRYIFQMIGGEEKFHLVSQTGYLLTRLAKQRQLARTNNSNELTGQAAWPGIFRGRARVVLTLDAKDQTIDASEVLVSIQSNPALLPLLNRCGAIVTDDGGIGCHAAILARELKKPTLIGTREATTRIQTGDLIEVDTYAQVVRILEQGE